MSVQHSSASVGRSAFWSIANQMAGQILVLLVFLVTARFVDKEAFGVMATALIIVELFKQVFLESVGVTFYARKNPTNEDYNTGFFIIFLGGLGSAILIYALASPLSAFLDLEMLEKTLHWIAILLFAIGLFKMHEIWLIKNQQFKPLAIRSIVSISIGGAIGIAMAVNGYDIEALVAQQLITALITTIWLWFVTPWKPSFKFNKSEATHILKYVGQVSLSKLAGFANGQSDIFFTAYYLGAATTGIYNAAKRLVMAVIMIVGAGIGNVVFPTLTDFSNDDKQLGKAYLKSITLITFFTAPIFAGMAAIPDHLINLLLGEKWMSAVPAFAILCAFGFVRILEGINSNILYIKGKPNWQTGIIVFTGVINVIILVAFAPYGLIPLVMALTISRMLLFPIMLTFALRMLSIHYTDFIHAIYAPLCAACIMFFGVAAVDFYWQPSVLYGLLILMPLGVCIYALMAYIFDRQLIKEIMSYMQMLKVKS